MTGATLVVCAEISDCGWRWLEPSLGDLGLKFEIVHCAARNSFEKNAYFNVARIRGCFEAVRIAKQTGAKALVTHGPTLAAWCSLVSRLLGVKIPILAHSFNFTSLPSPVKRSVFAAALSEVDRFVVFSTMERTLYAKTFGLPADRFDVVHWAVQPPYVDAPELPLESGEYVSAIGGNARDYSTLIEAARRMPEVRFVLVVRPENLRGLDLPSNVTVHTNLPFGKTMNVLAHSQFMVLPLIGSEVPCGHVTLVAAMHLGKAIVITDSIGVTDYVKNGENALLVAPGSIQNLVDGMTQLWGNKALCARLGENGRQFALRECSEKRIEDHFRNWLRTSGIAKTD